MVQAPSRQSVTAEACVLSPVRLHEICGEQSGTMTYTISLRVLQFLAISIIPPMFHTLLVAVIGRTIERNLAIFHSAILFHNSGRFDREMLL
jgi:hypothetical protein